MWKVMKAALSASASLAVLALVGCATQSGNMAMNSGDGAARVAPANQGQFPTAAYVQEQEPSYALTGQDHPNWVPVDRTINAGNARVTIPATP